MRPTRAITALLLVTLSCASVEEKQESLESRQQYAPVPSGFTKIKVVLMPFSNSARMGAFDIIPDGNYNSQIIRAGSGTIDQDDLGGWVVKSHRRSSETTNPVTPDPEKILPGDLYREIAETELFQTGRFEIIPYPIFAEERKRIDPDGKDPASLLKAASNLGVHLLLSGDCTDFEIKQSTQYWKVPLWAIVLAASFAINDHRLRETVWEVLIRLMFAVPLNSPFWDAGVGWEDTDLDVNLSVNLRASGLNGVLKFADESSIKRTETVRNLDLLVWKQTRRLRIQKSSAGRQIRFAVDDLARKFASLADSGLLH